MRISCRHPSQFDLLDCGPFCHEPILHDPTDSEYGQDQSNVRRDHQRFNGYSLFVYRTAMAKNNYCASCRQNGAQQNYARKETRA
jgi:hypothetical protein